MIKIVIAKQLRPGSARFQIPISLSDVRDQFAGIKMMVRKGGFEPPRLSAPPPQDGVSASSTTSARKQTAGQQHNYSKGTAEAFPSSRRLPCIYSSAAREADLNRGELSVRNHRFADAAPTAIAFNLFGDLFVVASCSKQRPGPMPDPSALTLLFSVACGYICGYNEHWNLPGTS